MSGPMSGSRLRRILGVSRLPLLTGDLDAIGAVGASGPTCETVVPMRSVRHLHSQWYLLTTATRLGQTGLAVAT